MKWIFLVVAGFAVASPADGAGPEWRVVHAGPAGVELVGNGGFGEHPANLPAGWRQWQDGFEFTADGGRNHSAGVICEVREKAREAGVCQSIVLNRTTAAPVVVRGWSKAAGVDGSPDSGYSVYVDIVHADGTPLWGQA